MSIKISILTVGEYSTARGLHASQVLSFAKYLKHRKIDSQWISFMPFESAFKDALLNNRNIKALEIAAADSGIELHTVLFPITIARLHSYFFRNPLVKSAGKRLAKLLTSQDPFIGRHIIHCRSYFAAATALEARKSIESLEISFDMRSLLPPEIPMKYSFAGGLLYGGLKQWERDLLMASNFTFLQCRRGISLLELEGIKRLPCYIPIIGFDTPPGMVPEGGSSFAFGYVGSFSSWQSSKVLEAVFIELSKNIPNCSFDVITSKSIAFSIGVNQYSTSNEGVKEALTGMTALVIPGPESCDDYYSSLKLSSNYFTTKAAEALSVGVPLIVNKNAIELAQYAKENKCGIAFSIENGEVSFEGMSSDALSNVQFWTELRAGAIKCSLDFDRSVVFEKYLETWNAN